MRKLAAAALIALALPATGCVSNLRTDEMAGQSLDDSARWADGFKHRLIGDASGTAHGAYSPAFIWWYWMWNLPVVDGGVRKAYVKHAASWVQTDAIEAAAHYDAIQSVKGADVLLAVRVKKDTTDMIWGLWRDETVTVIGKAVAISD